MISSSVPIRQSELRIEQSPLETCRRLRARQQATVFFDGTGGFAETWATGPLLALGPEICLVDESSADGLARLDPIVAGRRTEGGTAETGVAVLLSYDALHGGGRGSSKLPQIVAFRVDRSLRFLRPGLVRVTERGPERQSNAWRDLIAGRGQSQDTARAAACVGGATTSLPRDRYIRTVARVREHIAQGDIYQANLCQRFMASYRGDVFELYASLTSRSAAPQSAFVEARGFALASVSPEIFLRMSRFGQIETWPIKGTRPRGKDRESDLRTASDLQASPKDRAELLMIVDLERNDLSRVCRAGTVRVSQLARLRSYARVHHLVAGIHGELREGVGLAEILRATFPGGSITGAPKLRAMEILREIEPVDRHWFTGSLFWFGDDGSLDSSILIRSWIFDGSHAYLGAGGGIVADSDPEQEWHESNVKARVLALAMGFDPEEAV